jgi:hypothetical protein
LAQATSRLHSLAAASWRACPCRRRTSPSTRRTDPAHGACAGRTAFFVQSQQHEAGPSDRSIVVVVTLSHNTHRPAPAGGTSSGEDGGSGTGDAVAHALRLRTGVIARNKPTAGDERHCTGGGGAGEAAGTTFGEDLMADGALMGRNNRVCKSGAHRQRLFRANVQQEIRLVKPCLALPCLLFFEGTPYELGVRRAGVSQLIHPQIGIRILLFFLIFASR